MQDWWKQLRWNATAHGWVAKTDEVSIFVTEGVYEQHLATHLESLGMERKTWTQIMAPAEAEWKRYCEVVQAFHANLDYWLSLNERTGEVRRRQEPTEMTRRR